MHKQQQMIKAYLIGDNSMKVILTIEDFERVKECFRLYKKYPNNILTMKQKYLLDENIEIYKNQEIKLSLFQNLDKILKKLKEQDNFIRLKVLSEDIFSKITFSNLEEKEKVIETLEHLLSKNIDISICFSSQNTKELEENLREIYLKIIS